MTKTELVKLIKEVVKREVKKQMNEILIKEQRLSKVSSKKSKPITEKQFKEPIRRKYTEYTKNETLNNILNETVGGIEGSNSGGGEFDEYPTVGGQAFDSTRMAEALGYGELAGGNEEVAREMGAVKTIKDAGLSVEQVPDGVVNAMTRDYSDLMKVINKKGK